MTRKITALAALLLAAALIFCGCKRDVSYIAEYDGAKVSVSDYALKMFTAFSSAKTETGEKENDVSAILSHEIDGVPAEQWIQDEALRLLREQLAVDAEFERLGLTLSDEDIAKSESNAETQWNKYSETYTKNGVEKASLAASNQTTLKPQYIFEALYAQDGEKALSTDELASYFDGDYQLFRIIGIAKRDKDGEFFTGDELDAQLEKANEYASRLKSGEDGDTLVAQAEEELCELLETELDHEHGDVLESHISIAENGELFYSVEIMELIGQLTPGEVELYEDDESYYFVIQKLSAADNTELLESNRFAISYELCIDEFNEYIASLTEAVELTLNDAAVKCHTPHLFVLG